MSRRLTTILLIASFITIPFSFAVFGLTEPDIVRVFRVKVKGVKSITSEALQQSISTVIPSFYAFWFDKPEFDEVSLDEDMVRIRHLYSKHGFYEAEASYTLKYNKKNDLVSITITVKEGKPIKLRSFDIVYDTEVSKRILKKIKKNIPLKIKKRFSPIKYQQTKDVIKLIFANNGYPNAEVRGEAIVNRQEKWAEVSLRISPGELYHFGFTLVGGNKKVRSSIITRESDYKKGDTYSRKEVEDTQARIFGLGMFNSVLIDEVYSDEEKLVHVNIDVTERKLGTFKIGVGFGSEDLFRGRLSWTQLNFFGNGRRLSIAGKFSFLVQSLEATFSQPYFLGSGSELFFTTNTRRDDLLSFAVESQIGTLGVKKIFSNKYQGLFTYTFQLSRLSEISEATSEFITDDKYHLSFFTLGFERNSTGRTVTPKRGSATSLFVELSSNSLWSEVEYVKSTFTIRKYKKLFGSVLAARFDIGVLQPFGSTGRLEVPIFKRFFAGGSTTVRGFAFQKLGPLDDNKDPVGGNSLLIGSLESRFPIWRDIGGVVFLDIGNVYSQEWDFRLDQIKYSPGLGLRYDTLIGPLRIDVGYTVNPDSDLRPVHVHISIGNAF